MIIEKLLAYAFCTAVAAVAIPFLYFFFIAAFSLTCMGWVSILHLAKDGDSYETCKVVSDHLFGH